MTTPTIDGAELLDDVAAWFGRFIKTSDLELLALWTLHTHLAKELYTTPRLQIDSIMPGSGKTTVLDHFSRLCYSPVQIASAPSSALLPRTLSTGMHTILLDEIDRTLRPDAASTPELLAILNSGYRSGATRPVLVPDQGGWKTEKMPTHAPVAMAGNAPNLPEDTKSRCIRILLMPDVDGTVEDSDWEMIEDDARALHDRIVQFAEQVRDDVKGLDANLPAKCIGRAKEKWRPLKRVAIVADPEGVWPAAVDGMIADDLAAAAAEREAGLQSLPPGMMLLKDLHALWPDHDDLVPTRELVEKLIHHHSDYWGPFSSYGKALTDHRLGRLLSQASKVTSQRPGGRGPRGYYRRQLQPVWRQLGFETGTPSDESGASGYSGAAGAEPHQLHQPNHLHRIETDPRQTGAEPGEPCPYDPSRRHGKAGCGLCIAHKHNAKEAK